MEIDPANAYAQKMQRLLDKGKNLSGKQRGKLVEQNEAAISQMADRKTEYQSAKINNAILQLVERVKNGLSANGETVQLQTVTDEAAERIQQITGVDVHGYKVAIEARQIEHILKDHGENGLSDHSMANPED